MGLLPYGVRSGRRFAINKRILARKIGDICEWQVLFTIKHSKSECIRITSITHVNWRALPCAKLHDSQIFGTGNRSSAWLLHSNFAENLQAFFSQRLTRQFTNSKSLSARKLPNTEWGMKWNEQIFNFEVHDRRDNTSIIELFFFRIRKWKSGTGRNVSWILTTYTVTVATWEFFVR